MDNINLKNSLKKISPEVKNRLDGYIFDFDNNCGTAASAYCSIASYCLALYDCGILSLLERVELSWYYCGKIEEIEEKREK